MSTFCGFNSALDGVLISPALLNSRSDGSCLPGSTDIFGQADKAWEIPLRFSATTLADLRLHQSRGTSGIVEFP